MTIASGPLLRSPTLTTLVVPGRSARSGLAAVPRCRLSSERFAATSGNEGASRRPLEGPLAGPRLDDSRRQTRRIALGTLVRFIGRTLGALISLAALREATRYFGPIRWGPITATLAWFTVFSYLGSPGLGADNAGDRTVGRRPWIGVRSALGATIVISLAAAVASSVVALPVYWDKDATLSMVLILAPGVPLLALFLTSGSVLVGAGRGTARALLTPSRASSSSPRPSQSWRRT